MALEDSVSGEGLLIDKTFLSINLLAYRQNLFTVFSCGGPGQVCVLRPHFKGH